MKDTDLVGVFAQLAVALDTHTRQIRQLRAALLILVGIYAADLTIRILQ